MHLPLLSTHSLGEICVENYILTARLCGPNSHVQEISKREGAGISTSWSGCFAIEMRYYE
jgi:hypothetical protein